MAQHGEGLRAAFDADDEEGLRPLVDIGLPFDAPKGRRANGEIFDVLGSVTVGELPMWPEGPVTTEPNNHD